RPEPYTLSLHDALPIFSWRRNSGGALAASAVARQAVRPEKLALSAPSLCRTKERTPSAPIRQSPAAFSRIAPCSMAIATEFSPRSEEHTSELQSLAYLV